MRHGTGVGSIASLALALLCTSARAAGGATGVVSRAPSGTVYVGWKGQSYAIDRLPAEVPEPAKEALACWLPWVGEHGYRFDLDSSGRALLISPSGNSAVSKQMSLIEKVMKFTDEHAPVPPHPAADKPKPASSPGGDAIPEDPEAPPAAARPSFEEQMRGKTTLWGAGSTVLDRDTAVLLVIKNEEQYASVLAELGKIAPYLASWVGGATKLQGFTLEQPLAGAFLLEKAGQEEWNPENELVHRAAELMLTRRFGREPYWLLEGWAWHVEMTLCADVYCFPYRSEFVWATEHTGWEKVLHTHAAAIKEPELGIGDIARLKRGVWDDRNAKFAWGTALFLDRYKTAAWGPLLTDMQHAWDTGGRKDLGGGKWERDPNFEVAPADQAALFRKHAGDDFFAELTRFFRTGAAPAPPPRGASKSVHISRD